MIVVSSAYCGCCCCCCCFLQIYFFVSFFVSSFIVSFLVSFFVSSLVVSFFVSSFVHLTEAVTSCTATFGRTGRPRRRTPLPTGRRRLLSAFCRLLVDPTEVDAAGELNFHSDSEALIRVLIYSLHSSCVTFLVVKVTFGAASVSREHASSVRRKCVIEFVCSCVPFI